MARGGGGMMRLLMRCWPRHAETNNRDNSMQHYLTWMEYDMS